MSFEWDRFAESGVHIARGLLDVSEISSVREGFLRAVQDQLRCCAVSPVPEGLFDVLKLLHRIDIDRYKKTAAAMWRRVDVNRLMHHEKIVGFLEDRFGFRDMFLPGGGVMLIMSEALKIPNGYFGLNPHQDFPSVQGSLDGVVAWIPLVDVDRSNYPIEVIPGSHRQGLVTSVTETGNGWEITRDQYSDEDFTPLEAAIGDVVFMSVFTIHRSSLKGGPDHLRLALSTRFDNGAERTFIERCYPTAYVRTVHREQYAENFPRPDQIARLWLGRSS